MKKFFAVLAVLFFAVSGLPSEALAMAPWHICPVTGQAHRNMGWSPEECNMSGEPGICATEGHTMGKGSTTAVGSARTVNMELTSPDGRPVFFLQQVSNFLLDFPQYVFYNNYGGIPQFPASSDPRMNAAEQAMNPQLMWEAFGMVFQDAGYVENSDNRVKKDENSVYYSHFEPVRVVDYRVPSTKSPDVWLVNISGKITETVDDYNLGTSIKRTLAAMGLNLGAWFALEYSPNRTGRSVAMGAITLADALASYQKYQITVLKRIAVTIQFKNAANGKILTWDGSTKDLVPILFGDFTFFRGYERGNLHKISLKEAIGDAIEVIKLQAAPALQGITKEIRIQSRITQILEKSERGEQLTVLESEILKTSKKVEAFRGEGLDQETLRYLRSQKSSIEQAPATTVKPANFVVDPRFVAGKELKKQ